MQKPSMLVVLSGGQDSTTCLFWAKREVKKQGGDVHAITFNYGQRHVCELIAAQVIGEMAGVVSHEVTTLPVDVLKSSSPLVDMNADVGHYESEETMPGGVEPTFVPGRNLLFITLAANYAAHIGCTDIVLGVCEEDFGGYPDCRSDFIDAAEHAVERAFGHRITIHTPLMNLTKKESVILAKGLPACLGALSYSHTCYDGEYPPNPHNHASILRAKGFDEARCGDPLIERAIAEGLLPSDYPTSGLVFGTKYNEQESNSEPN